MKRWLARLFGTREAGVPVAVPADSAQDRPGAAADAALAQLDLDLAFFHWLAGPHVTGRPAPDGPVLDELARLARDPHGAAALVPRVPAVIPQLLRSLREDATGAGALARQVAQDPVLVAEVIREVNSPYYQPASPIRNLEGAVLLLGQNGLRMLLARIAFRPLIRMADQGFARHAAPLVWNQSEKCALASSLMAPGLGAGVFEAYLAGLMQNLGLVVAFRLAERAVENGKIPGSSYFGRRLFDVSRGLSSTIAAHWEFPPDVVEGIAGVGQPDASPLARTLERGDRIAKLRLLLDAHVVLEDDALVTEGLDSFERRCLGKLTDLPG